MTISAKVSPGLRVSFDYFGTEFWAQSSGYRDQCTPEFLDGEIDVEFMDLHEEH